MKCSQYDPYAYYSCLSLKHVRFVYNYMHMIFVLVFRTDSPSVGTSVLDNVY